LFGASTHERRGTTNVDYSWSLYNHFKQLRSYRESRFKVDPEGFEVAVAGAEDFASSAHDGARGAESGQAPALRSVGAG